MSRPTTSATASRGRAHFTQRFATRTTASQRTAASIEQIEFEACLPYRPFALRAAAAAAIPSIEEEDQRRPRSARLATPPTPAVIAASHADSAPSLDAQEPFALSLAPPISPLQLRSNNDFTYTDEHERSGSDVRTASRERSVSPASLWRRSRSTDRTDLVDLLCSSSESEGSRIISVPVSRSAVAAAKRSPGVSPSSSFRAPLSPTLEAQQPAQVVVPTLPFARRPSASVSRSPSTGSYGLTRGSSSYAMETSLVRRVSGSSVHDSEAGTASPRVSARRLSSIYATTGEVSSSLRRKSSTRSSAETSDATLPPLDTTVRTPTTATAAQSGNLSRIFVADKATRRARSNTGPPSLLRSSTAVAAPSLVVAQADAPPSPTRKSTASLAILNVERVQNAALPSSSKQEVREQSVEVATMQRKVAEAVQAVKLPRYGDASTLTSSPQETLFGSRPTVASPQRSFAGSYNVRGDSDSSDITLSSDSTLATPLDSGEESELEQERSSRSNMVDSALTTVPLRESRSRSRARTFSAARLERRRFVKQLSTPLPRPSSSGLGLLDVVPMKDIASAWPSLTNEAAASISPRITLPLYAASMGKPARKHLSSSPAHTPPPLSGFAYTSRRGSLTPRAGSTTPIDSRRSTPTLGKRALPLLHDVEELVGAALSDESGTASGRGSFTAAATDEHERFVRARTSIVV